MVDHFQQDIEREVIDMCNGMIEGTEKEGSVIPIPYLQLCTLNIIFIMTLGKRFETLNDPEVNEIVAMFKKNIQYGGIENDLSNYLPIMAVADWFSNTKAEMKDHFSNCRDRIIKRLMSEALSKHEINFVKTLDDGGRLEEGDKIALLSKSK